MFGILLRPFPIIENVKIIDGTFWQIMYLLLPEITYYLLVIYSVLKIFELKNNLKHKHNLCPDNSKYLISFKINALYNK